MAALRSASRVLLRRIVSSGASVPSLASPAVGRSTAVSNAPQWRAMSSGPISKSPVLLHDALSPEKEKQLIEDFGHVTGLEKEELVAQLKGKERFNMQPITGPFGTPESPAFIESSFDERIVGCTGGYGEEEHDIVWFRLHKDQDVTCPICSQYFKLKVMGPGGVPGAHH